MKKKIILKNIEKILIKNNFKFSSKNVEKINIFKNNSIDSFKLLSIISEIETKYKIKFSTSFIQNSKNNIENIADLIEKKKK
tara:strand:- start:1149 stop:1394 length:246 start_codon:yes stop_codon:yes gene_type:complete